MKPIQSVLVYGATGDQGELQLAPLLHGQYRVRAAVRDPSARDARFAGIERVQADYEDVPSLERASAGMDAVLLNLPFIFDKALAASYGQRVVDAARRAGVRLLVFNTSAYVADHDIGLSAHDGRVAIEAAIRASGIDHVILRPVVFMDNTLRPWEKPSIIERGIFAYPAGPALTISWIALSDVAEYMVKALSSPRAWNRSFVIGGPEVLTGDQVAERLSEGMGRTIRFRSITPDEFARTMSKLITGSEHVEPDSMWDRMGQFYRWYNAQPVSPLAVDIGPVLEALPIRPTLFAEWARRQDWSA
jgi:NAD(P)H dehydrogenase (quinone)